MNWHLCNTLWDNIMAPMQGETGAIVGSVLAWTLPYLQAFSILGIAAMLFVAMYRPGGEEQINKFLRTAFFLAFALAIVSHQDLYTAWVMGIADLIPTKLGNAITGMGNGGHVDAAAFDKLWGTAFKSAVQVYNSSGWNVKALVIGIGCLVFIAGSALATLFLFAIYLSTEILVLLVVTLGGPFIAMAPFEQTRRFFEGWITALVSCVVAKVLAILILSVLIRLAGVMLQPLTGAPSGNAIEGLGTLCELGITFFLFAQLARQVIGLAGGLVGGLYHEVGAYHSAIYGTVGNAAKGATGAAMGGASSAASSLSQASTHHSSVSAPAIRPAGRAI